METLKFLLQLIGGTIVALGVLTFLYYISFLVRDQYELKNIESGPVIKLSNKTIEDFIGTTENEAM